MGTPTFVNYDSATQASTTSISKSFTPGADVDFVVVDLSVDGAIASLYITYRGVLMQMIGAANNSIQLYSYYLVGPPGGSSTVAASWTPARNAQMAIRGYKNVRQSNPFATPAAIATGTSTSVSVNVSSAVGELVIDAIVSNGTPTVGPGQAWRYFAGEYLNSAGSDEPGASSVTMSWSVPYTNWGTVAVSLKPSFDTQIIVM
jgi:hypothetical protein